MFTSLLIAGKLWRRQLRRVDFWIVIAVLGIFFWSYFNAGQSYMMAINETVGVFSVFPISMTDRSFILIIYACLLILVSDVPILPNGSEYQILRISRLRWYAGQVLYIVFLNVTYFLMVAAIQLACFFPAISFDGEWGQGILSGSAFSSFSLSVPALLLKMQPQKAFGLSFLLSVFLGLLFSTVCFLFNLLAAHDGLGVLICAAAIGIGDLCGRYGYDVGFLSPVGLVGSYAGQTYVPVPAAVGYYLFFSCLMVLVGICRIGRTDLKCGTN